MLSRLVGLKNLGYNPASAIPYPPYLGDEGESESEGPQDSDRCRAEVNNSSDEPKKITQPYPSSENKPQPKDLSKPTGRQMKYAQDL